MVKKKRQSDPGEGDDSTESCEENIKSACPHIPKAIDLTRLKKALKIDGFKKDCLECLKEMKNLDLDPEYEVDTTLWMCLRCGLQLCGRTRNKHALNHYNTPHSDCHALTTNTTTWNIFCYNCNNEIGPSTTKKLLETIEYLKKQAAMKVNNKTDAESQTEQKTVIVLEPPKGKDKMLSPIQRVRGLSNLGNTCFFNSVLQCLVQTPYLLPVLQQMSTPGEKFTLPGGVLKIEMENGDGKKEMKEMDLPPITGELSEWGMLTRTLAETLAELQSPGKCDVYTPRKLLSSLVNKLPQFGGGDQHDAHELLRHLLEAVRSEDLRRYQSVILSNLGLSCKVDPSKVDGEVKQKVKFYGQQASDTMLRPEQVFRGFLVSTLECQECFHTSDRHEYFLDLSLPVAADRPQPPATRRKTADDELYNDKKLNNQKDDPSKYQMKKERRNKEKKSKSKHKGSSTNKSENNQTGDATCPTGDNKSSSEQSDADIEDNTEENTGKNSVWAFYNNYPKDPLRTSPVQQEKTDETPENPDKDKEEIAVCSAAIPLQYKPIVSPEFPSNPDSGVASPAATQHNSTENVDRTESPGNSQESGVQANGSTEDPDIEDLCPRPLFDDEPSNEVVARGISAKGSDFVKYGLRNSYESLTTDLDSLKLIRPIPPIPLAYPTPDPYCPLGPSPTRKDYSPYSYRTTPMSPRYQPEEGECSIQSCLNQFTALELMTGNNKVGCEACTERINGKNGKTVYTNATKRFLVSNPPAVLILHLKRFQLGPRCTFRKICKHVDFQTVLDLAPFCRGRSWATSGQNELQYSLYGVVEHSGGMHGGHYVAYVKVRPPVPPGHERWNFIAKGGNVAPPENGDLHTDSDSSLSGYESGGGTNPTPPQGKWYYISDSRVSEITEDKVLSAQAYLLFYERIQ